MKYYYLKNTNLDALYVHVLQHYRYIYFFEKHPEFNEGALTHWNCILYIYCIVH
jgi:hypothetical protein